MDCKKLNEIYNKCCDNNYEWERYVFIDHAMKAKNINIEKNLCCLKSMKFYNKYCKEEMNNITKNE